MAIHICTALPVALMSFVHHLMHLVPSLMMVIMVVMIAVVMSLTMLVMIAMVMLLMLVMIAMMVVSLAMLVVALTMLVMIAVVMTAMVMIAMIATLLGEHIKHLWALVVAVAVARDASLVTGMNLHDFWAHSRSLFERTFWFFGKLLVHPFQLRLRTIITFCFLACFMASFDSREILASLHERDPWFWALGVAIWSGSTLLFASHPLLPHFGEVLVPGSFVVVVVLISTLFTLFVLCLPHREQLHGTLI